MQPVIGRPGPMTPSVNVATNVSCFPPDTAGWPQPTPCQHARTVRAPARRNKIQNVRSSNQPDETPAGRKMSFPTSGRPHRRLTSAAAERSEQLLWTGPVKLGHLKPNRRRRPICPDRRGRASQRNRIWLPVSARTFTLPHGVRSACYNGNLWQIRHIRAMKTTRPSFAWCCLACFAASGTMHVQAQTRYARVDVAAPASMPDLSAAATSIAGISTVQPRSRIAIAIQSCPRASRRPYHRVQPFVETYDSIECTYNVQIGLRSSILNAGHRYASQGHGVRRLVRFELRSQIGKRTTTLFVNVETATWTLPRNRRRASISRWIRACFIKVDHGAHRTSWR